MVVTRRRVSRPGAGTIAASVVVFVVAAFSLSYSAFLRGLRFLSVRKILFAICFTPDTLLKLFVINAKGVLRNGSSVNKLKLRFVNLPILF